MSYLYLCEVCNGTPWWQVQRRGDLITSWACTDHLSAVCLGLQRADTTELIITEFGGPALDLPKESA